METVTTLRELWRHRALVAVVALASIFAGYATAYKVSLPPESRSFEAGIATGRILVDTPDSQVVDVQPKGSGTLGIRAGVLANLMTEGDVKAAIAERAGLRPDQLRAGVEVDGELPAVLTNAAGNPNAHLLTTRPAVNPDGTPLPMIDIHAQAPTPRDAATLAKASVSGLNDYLDSKAAGEDVPEARRLDVTGLGAPQVQEETLGERRLLAVAATIVSFLLGCAAILVVPRLARDWRLARTLEVERKAEQPDGDGEAPEAVAKGDAEAGARRSWRKVPGLMRSPAKTGAGSAATPVADREEPSRNGDAKSAARSGAEAPSRNGDAEPEEEPAEADSATVRS
jgi:hypothetical protein